MKVFSASIDLQFADLSVVALVDYLYLPLVRDGLIFLRFIRGNKLNQLSSFKLWHSFKYAALAEALRQNVLSSVRFCKFDENTEKLLKARIIDQSDKNYPHDPLDIYAGNASTLLRNQIALNNLPGEVYSIEDNDKSPDDCSYPFSVIQSAQSQKQTNTED